MIGDEHIFEVVARHEQTIAKQREVIRELESVKERCLHVCEGFVRLVDEEGYNHLSTGWLYLQANESIRKNKEVLNESKPIGS